MTPRLAVAALIAISALFRIVAASNLGLGNDEAYHFLYALHPALSYFDHPPMLAWVETLGLSGSPDLYSALGLRAGFVALFAGSTWLMARIAGRWFGDWAGFFAALALNLTGYYGLAVGTFALPDGPLLFFWLLTIDRIDLALERPERLRLWAAVGLAWGLAMLSKYHAVFLPVGTVFYLALRPGRRRLLLHPGPYLAVALGLIVFSPVIIWNVNNGWASFAFQGSRAVGGFRLRPDCLLGAIAAQAAYLFPWIWVMLMAVGWRLIAGWKDRDDERERLALCLCATPLGVFTAVACTRPVLPHWGLIGIVPLFPSLGRVLADRAVAIPSRSRRRLALAAAFSVLVLAITLTEARTGWVQRTGLLTAKTDPTADGYGWDQVADRLERLGVLDDPRTFIFTRNWFQSAQIAHATRLRRPVVCYNMGDARGFAFWSDPAEWVGRDGVMVMIDDDYTPFAFYEHFFNGCQPLDDYQVVRAGVTLRRVRVFRLNEQTAAVPYGYTREQALERDRLKDQLSKFLKEDPSPPQIGRTPAATRVD